jgi:PEP-CTERM motif
MKLRHVMAVLFATGVVTVGGRSAVALGPFSYAPFEIDDFERTTVTSPEKPALGNIGEPIALQNSSVEFEPSIPQFAPPGWVGPWGGGVLGHVGTGAFNANNLQDMYPGGWAMAVDTVNYGNCCGSNNNFPSAPAYNHSQLQVISKSDPGVSANDKLGITSGNQALKISMDNVGQGDGDTAIDRPVSLVIKSSDFYGNHDSRFDRFEAVRSDPSNYRISIDVTVVADDMPDQFTYGLSPTPYFRVGLFAHNGGTLLDESPASVLQGPDMLNFSNADADGDGLPNFTDPDYVDPGNPAGLPGHGKPGVIQRRYTFPASAIDWPATSLAGVADPTTPGAALQQRAGGIDNAYQLGLIFDGNWGTGVQGTSSPASIIIDNFRILPVESPPFDLNGNGLLDRGDWEILVSHLNGPGPYTYAEGDIDGFDGKVDFQDFSRFEQLWDAYHGAGSFEALQGGGGAMLPAVPEPSTLLLMGTAVGGSSFLIARRRQIAMEREGG